MTGPNEKQFEEMIAENLILHGGYVKGDPKAFNPKTALDERSFIDFIKRSQPKEWKRHSVNYAGRDPENALIKRFNEAVKHNGLINVLRKGWDDRGVKFRPVFWKPETKLNETTQSKYDANVLHCVRQLHYSANNQNSVDIVLFLNGVPVVSMELKCQFTGQDVTNAVKQYQFDRSPSDLIFQFNRRVLVHFAVDLKNVFMTTRLDGDKTRFLPFNQGSGGAGNVGGAGNPPNPHGETSYLWEEVLRKERLLEILQKYIHLDGKENGDGRIIFPRYHQLDVVSKLIDDVKENGAGKNYLIQHSAGSGKSNSIAWLAHRLSGLHDENDRKIFKSVIVVTDRKVLDSQLQKTITDFELVKGLIQRVDKNSQQLKEALENNVGIIITTIQKFPVIYREVESRGKRFAVIVDEAHSSQTGDSARKLKRALADTEEALKEFAELENQDEENRLEPYDHILDALATEGHQKNLSFFAFTATPKEKTLQIFGEKGPDGIYRPFHVYSMRQAIEEGFILDVLKNYMTYTMFFKILKKIKENPELETAAGTKAIKLFETLHPHNIAQKTAVMLDHFMNATCDRIGGKAKAMVVTSSRLHAVRYFHEFKRQITERKLPVDVLVAFSGEVNDQDETFTEEKLNKTQKGETIRESALPKTFHGDEFNILVVAEKYQTGFDEPLLHTMYVDKQLSGVKAVQTLSRLNRIYPGKEDTFVLDFVNTAESIKKSFAPFYEQTTLEQETDPNVVYNLRDTLFKYNVFDENEIDSFYKTFADHNEESGRETSAFPVELSQRLRPALDRYDGLKTTEKELFKTTLSRFIRVHSFIAQAYRLFDKKLYKFSIFSKFLLKLIPRDVTEKIDVDGKVLLEYYRLEKSFEGAISLEPGKSGTRPITGSAGRREKKRDHLSELIELVNEKFGTDWNETDRLSIKQIEEDCEKEKGWREFAQKNTLDMFLQLFNDEFRKKVLDRSQRNEYLFSQIMDNEGMMEIVMKIVGPAIYEKFRSEKSKKV